MEINPQKARFGYYPTVWPNEHTDQWRTHTVLDAGLPKNFKPAELAVNYVDVDIPVWGYTRDRNQIFTTGGSPAFISEYTKMIIAGSQTPVGASQPRGDGPSNGAHRVNDGAQERRHIPIVAKIDPPTMKKEVLELPYGTTVNYTGGLLMHANGYVYAVARSVLYKIDPASMKIAAHKELPWVGSGAQQFFTTYNGMQVTASGDLIVKAFYLPDSTVPGVMLLVNPDDLASLDVREAEVSGARMTVEQVDEEKAYLYILTAATSTRYLITADHKFKHDHKWLSRYITEGSTQASSSVFFGNQIAFSNNTSPVSTTPMKLFSQPIDNPPSMLTPQTAFRQDNAGINFFMIGGDPFLTNSVVVFDPINRYVAMHHLTQGGTMEPRWERQYKMSASPALVPDRDLLYIDDFDYNKGRDYFLVVRLSTGEELARVELPAKEPTVGCIFVGMNQDVFMLSSETGEATGYVSRIHVGQQ